MALSPAALSLCDSNSAAAVLHIDLGYPPLISVKLGRALPSLPHSEIYPHLSRTRALLPSLWLSICFYAIQQKSHSQPFDASTLVVGKGPFVVDEGMGEPLEFG
jgi:hypothetical protein